MAKRIGEVLREARLAAGLSIRDLARATGMATGEISQIETGNRRADPAFSVVARIARGVGIDLGLLARRMEGDDIALTSQPGTRESARLRRALSRALSESTRVTERIQNVLDCYPSEKKQAKGEVKDGATKRRKSRPL